MVQSAATTRPTAGNPPRNTIPLSSSDALPNQTLYCKNLNDKIHKSDLKTCLYELCCPFGPILEIVCRNRGYAFVVFGDLSSASMAFRALQNFMFLDKPLQIQYAKKISDAVLVSEKIYQPRKAGMRRPVIGPTDNIKVDLVQKPPDKVFTLMVEGLLDDSSKVAIETVFGQYPGFIESRLVEGRGLAFVDFVTEKQAEAALQGLQGFKITPEHALRLSWSK